MLCSDCSRSAGGPGVASQVLEGKVPAPLQGL